MWQDCDFWLNSSFQLSSYVGGFNLNSETLDSSSSWMWPWRQSWTKSYLVNGVVIFCSVLHWLYKSVPRPPPLRHLSGSEHAAGRREALLWNLIPTFTEHGRYSTSAWVSPVRFCIVLFIVCSVSCRSAACSSCGVRAGDCTLAEQGANQPSNMEPFEMDSPQGVWKWVIHI